MFCTSCGLKNAEDSNFCKQCGQRLEKFLPARITEADFERAMPEEEQVTALLEHAYQARKEGNSEAAIAYCKEALRLRPESTSAHSLLGQLYEQSGDREQAIREYERVLALNPGSIADRVKLDELREDMPMASTQRRTAPQIVIAERQNPQNRSDFRAPLTIAAALMLMALGGIFALQLRPRDPAQQRPYSNLPLSPTSSASSHEVVNAPQSGNPNGLVGGWQQPPIIINTPGPQHSTAPARNTEPLPPMQGETHVVSNSHPSRDTNASDGGDGDSNRVILRVNPDSDQSTDEGTKPESSAKVTVNAVAASTQNTEAHPAPNAQSLIRMADELKAKQDYKNAGAMYVKATETAGDDSAYAFQNAGWCFQQTGEKATAISYYQHGKAEAQKLIAAGKRVDISRDLIRVCDAGIKACSN